MEKLLIFFRLEICSGVYKVLVKRAVQLNWSAKKGGHLTSFKLEQPTTKILEQNSNSHKSVELLAKSISDFGNFGRHFPCATSAQIFAKSKRLCGRRWRNLFHIMGTAPKVEMARGCGLRTRLWLLIINRDEVFVISRIIKVEVIVISPSLRLRLITLFKSLIILDITKTECNNRFIIH